MDLFRHPDQIDVAERLIKTLEIQKKIVRAFEKAANHLRQPRIHPAVLGNCSYFIRAYNAGALGSSFCTEVSKMTLWELTFCAISFTEKQLQAVMDDLKVSDLKTYLSAKGLSSGHSAEVLRRLDYYCQGKNDKFRALYDLARIDVNKSRPVDIAVWPEPDEVQYTLCYGVKDRILPLLMPVFSNQMAAVPTWGTNPTTPSVRANMRTASVEFEIDMGVEDVNVDLSRVFSGTSWGTAELRKMHQVVIRTDRDQGSWLMNNIFIVN